MTDEISFDDLIPKKKEEGKQDDISFDDLIPKKADDHGLAERQKLSLVGKALNPINPAGGYGQAQQEIANEAWNLMGSGVSDIMHPSQGVRGAEPFYVGKGVVKTGLGALGYLASPALSAIRSVIGQPIEDVTGIPREYPEFAASLATPGLGFTKVPWLAEAPALPGFAPRLRVPNEILEASQRQGLDLPRAITSPSIMTKGAGQALGLTPIVGTPLRSAVQEIPAKIGRGVERIADEFGDVQPKNIVGGGIQAEVGKAGEAEAKAAREAYDAQQEAARLAAEGKDKEAREAWERANAAREEAIRARHEQTETDVHQALGRVDKNETSDDAINQVQAAHERADRAESAAYDKVNDLKAGVGTQAFEGLHGGASQALRDAGFTIEPQNYPNAVKLMGELEKLSGKPGTPPNIPPTTLATLRRTFGDNIPQDVLETMGFKGEPGEPPDFRLMGKHAPAPGATEVPIQGVETLRRRVNSMAFDRTAKNEDQAASNIIKNAVDRWYQNATENHLTPGSEPDALQTIRAARALHADRMERFGYNFRNFPAGGERRNAAQIVNRVVTGDIGPEKLAEHLTGSAGTRGVSAPLYERISNAVANPEQFRTNMRGSFLDQIAGQNRSANAVANDINRFLPTRMAGHLLEPNEHDLLRAFGESGQTTPRALKEAAAQARATEPEVTKLPKVPPPEPGKAETLAGRVLGAKGQRPEEAIYDQVNQMAKTDIKGFARTWGTMSEDGRNAFRARWLHDMGGGTGDNFSAGTFATNWNKYSDQAKAVLVRDRAHRESLNDFAKISREYGDQIKKYGNPSGTAQVTAWQKIAGTALKAGGAAFAGGLALFHPLGVLTAGVGMRQLAKMLAKPSGAQQVMRWNRLATTYNRSPSPGTLNALQNVTRLIEAQKDRQ